MPNKIIGDSENLNTLNKVIASPEALKAFRDGENLFVAIEFTDEFDVQFENAIKNSIRHMEKADLLTVRLCIFIVA